MKKFSISDKERLVIKKMYGFISEQTPQVKNTNTQKLKATRIVKGLSEDGYTLEITGSGPNNTVIATVVGPGMYDGTSMKQGIPNLELTKRDDTTYAGNMSMGFFKIKK